MNGMEKGYSVKGYEGLMDIGRQYCIDIERTRIVADCPIRAKQLAVEYIRELEKIVEDVIYERNREAE